MKMRKYLRIQLITVFVMMAFLFTPIPAKDDGKTLLLESLGHFSAQAVYLCYMSIGTIADGHAKEVYDNATAEELLSKTVNLCNGSVAQLNKLLTSGVLSGEDIAYVNGLIDTYNLLSAQGAGYRNYIKTGDKAHAQIFSSKRQAAWKKISELLDIKD